MKLVRPKFLSEDQRGTIRGFMQAHTIRGTSKDVIAESIGLSRSTLFDALKERHPISAKTWRAIEPLLKRIDAGDTSLPEQTTKVQNRQGTVELTGNEKTTLKPKELTELKTRISIGHEILMPVLQELLHGDVGTRKNLYQDEKTGPMVRELFTYTRGLQGEEMRLNVLEELDREDYNQ